MKKGKLIVIGTIGVLLVVAGLVTSYIDSARVRNSIEPKFVIKITTDGGNKVTYWGLGYKVVRYPSVSPNEPYKNSLGVKYGSWFMKYELSNYESIDLEKKDKEEAQIIETINTTFETYYKMSDGTWQMNGNSYKYRLEISGRMPNAVLDSTFVYLSNIEDIPFQRAYLAAGLSSSMADYFEVEDAVLVDYFNVE